MGRYHDQTRYQNGVYAMFFFIFFIFQYQISTQRRRSDKWTDIGRSSLGPDHGLHYRLGVERTVPDNARNSRESRRQRQTGFAECVRVSGVQD